MPAKTWNNSSNPLEQLLRAWEDMMFLQAIRLKHIFADKYHRYYPDRGGDINHWASFREYLLQSARSGSSNTPFDNHRFGAPTHRDFMADLFMNQSPQPSHVVMQLQFPRLLYNWTTHSRRVFVISAELQAEFSETKIAQETLSTLPLPFECFGIHLEVPILNRQGRGFNFLLPSRVPQAADYGCCLMVPTDIMEYPLLAPEVKTKLMGLVRTQSRRALKESLTTIGQFYSTHPLGLGNMAFDKSLASTPLGIYPALREQKEFVLPPTAHSSAFHKSTYDATSATEAVKILVGLCRYLQAFPAREGHHWRYQPATETGEEHRAITDTQQVCIVRGRYALNPDETGFSGEDEASSRLGVTMRPHHRRGYWRRPSGQGNNPLAPRSIWVKKSFVNERKLKEGELPVGSQTILGPIGK